jgi:hypothetical protein
MRQAQFYTAQYYFPRRVRTSNSAQSTVRPQTECPLVLEKGVAQEPNSWLWAQQNLDLTMLWYAFTWPFRLLFWTVAWIGRLSASGLGYCLMVIGIAVWTGPFVCLGALMFLVGLIMMLKCLD